MGKPINQEDQPAKVGDISKADAAVYIHDLLESLQKVAAAKELPMLAHLIGLAKIEAKRCSTP